MNPLDLLSRCLHVAGGAFILGGFLYARFVVWPAAAVLEPAQRRALWTSVSERFRPWALGSLVAVLASGLYNFMRLTQGGVPSTYHMVFGLKFLLALHVFAMLVLLAKPPSGDEAADAKRKRLAFGAAMSGIVIFVLAAYLRSLRG